VLVVGEFSRGKSTLINALVGSPLLPAKVNPTTATINVINGDIPGLIRVLYADGSVEELPLPSDQINKKIDGLVTTKNKHANAISVVTLQVPGRLSALHLEIVDTPGVNDLDEAREEITYRYLRQADAAVLLLDAQQPLNRSEKLFLTNKIFQNDIRRVLFVINKIDEVLSGGCEDDIPRIVDFVRSRLRNEIGIEPEVFAVSAKNALRARFKNEPDPGPVPFEDFERALLRIAQQNASSQRWQLHFERIRSVIRDQIATVQQQCTAVSVEIVDVQKNLESLVNEEALLDSVVQRLERAVNMACRNLAEAVNKYSYEQVEALRGSLGRKVGQITTVRDVEAFRAELIAELRNLVQGIEQFAEGYRAKMVVDLEQEFRANLADQALTLAPRRPDINTEQLLRGVPAITLPTNDPMMLDWKTLASGTGIGLLLGNLFGVFGVVAAVLGGLFMSKAERERADASLNAKAMQQIFANLEQALSDLSTKARTIGASIGATEADRLSTYISERGAQRRNSISKTIESSKRSLTASAEERRQLRTGWLNQIARLSDLENQCLMKG
jgi:GTPase SAR1 family protein